jgi:P-type Ca2+ transporter type 2C
MPSRDVELSGPAGLTQAEAEARLAAEGYNELPTVRRRDTLAIALEVVREPMFLLLVAAGTIYLMLGNVNEALVLLASVCVIIGITIYQEHKTERALEALRDLSSPRALVIRDGKRTRIAGREVVRGDILIIEEGDRIPADAVLLDCHDLKTDESLLTGESVPVTKVPWDGVKQIGRPGGDDLPFVYSGTLLTAGNGVAEVLATGTHTEMGRIGKALQGIVQEATTLQRETKLVVFRIATLGLVLCLLVVVLYGLTRGAWLDGFLAGITLAMAILPEEFPVVLTVFLALGAWRISKSRVLTRRVPVIETLGAATVLCVDKTGTLTLNRMRVSRLYAGGEFREVAFEGEELLPEQFHEVVEYSILASEIDPFDPMEKAFLELGNHFLASTEHLHADWELVHEYPLTTGLFAHAHAWRPRGSDVFVVASKGAPEAIAELCRLDAGQRQQLDARVAEMAARGLRVLGVARAAFHGQVWPESQRAFEFKWVGLIGLADPLRPTVADSLHQCYEAGIRVVMVTGDYPVTAQAIARQIGLTPADQVITGAQLHDMSDGELRERIRQVSIFARVVPEQKLRLVEAFKANGEIVAMTGDGVNDAPALKAAHIGIAMGGRGTDVAREAASLVLLEDDFDSIVHAVRLGRRIYRNIRNAMSYLLSVHVPIAGMAFVPLLLGWPVVFFPVHIVFFEFVIDPACSIAFEADPIDDEVMKRPPRRQTEHLFDFGTVALSLLQGASMLLMVALTYGWVLERGSGESEARAMAFATIVLGNLGLILSNRSRSRTIFATLRFPNPALWWVIGGTIAGLMLAMYVPFLRELFKFAPLHANDLLICVAAAVLGLLWFEIYKWRRWRSTRAQR